MHDKLQRLCERLNYKFQQPKYLNQALTHCSVGEHNNERLEFLGDSILSFVIANALYNQFPAESEGQLSRLRAHLVRGEMLAEIAAELEVGDCLFLGQGELKSGGFRRASILADSLEAIFAAIFLDGGIGAAQTVILSLFASRLTNSNLNDNLKDAKTQLQEQLQADKQPLPDYTLTNVVGESHEQMFYINCSIATLNLVTQGEGPTRRKAEQQAAAKLLQEIVRKKNMTKKNRY
ncbi:MAG: ribonuclease III [Legionella sp.]